MTDDETPLVVWRLLDGKAGHERQSAGLIAALAAIGNIRVCEYALDNYRFSLLDFVLRRIPFGARDASPDLIIGAGRRCQWPVICTRRARGGSGVYLMRPQLPVALFDLCIIPRHDSPRERSNIIVSDGVLNDVVVQAAGGEIGLILIGGPSAHYAWTEARLLEQIVAITDRDPHKNWVIADSRRTPHSTSSALASLTSNRVSYVAFSGAPTNWLTQQLSASDTVWVSADSVSMIYEALSAGVAVGVIRLPSRRDDRITRIVEDLNRRQLITTDDEWLSGKALRAGAPLSEAKRCAEIICKRWDPAQRRLTAA